jgi:hypothetical protein
MKDESQRAKEPLYLSSFIPFKGGKKKAKRQILYKQGPALYSSIYGIYG